MASEKNNKEHRKTLSDDTIDLLSLDESAEIIHKLHVHEAELEASRATMHGIRLDLEKMKGEYADLFDLTPIGLFIFGDNWIIRKANSAAADMLGLQKSDVTGKPFIAFCEPASIHMFLDLFHKVKETGQRQKVEIIMKRLGGAAFHVECDLSPARNKAGKITHFRAVLTDLDERAKRTGEIVRKYHEK